MSNRYFTAVLFSLLSSAASAAVVDFDACVDSLYGQGGVSKSVARRLCLPGVSADVLQCQKNRFLVNFQEPEAAFESCRRSPSIGSLPAEPYRGSYEAAPEPTAKQTVCSITVNSSEEREAFRSQLDPNRFDWVELLPQNAPGFEGRFIPRDDHWIRRACAAKTKCDVMVISGHFASTFLGSSGFEVKLEDLTKYSCEADCAPLFESVRQVYLFGCNTLAQKTPDHRSLSKYRDVLVEDGVSPHQAQRIVARRYTPYGDTIRDEIRSVFPKARQIFGFSTLGPTGKNVRDELKKYLRIAYAEHKSGDELTRNFSQTLAHFGMTVTTGQAKGELSCRQPRPRILDGSLASREGLQRFIDANGADIPVAAFDLIEEATVRGFIDDTVRGGLADRILQRAKLLNRAEQRKRICPLFATLHSRYAPADLNCQTDLSWL